MNEENLKKMVEATPFQRFTIRLIDGKFVRVPKSNLPSMEPSRQTATSNQTEIREMFRLVNGRFTRLLDLEADKGLRIGQLLPRGAKSPEEVAASEAKVPEKDGDK